MSWRGARKSVVLQHGVRDSTDGSASNGAAGVHARAEVNLSEGDVSLKSGLVVHLPHCCGCGLSTCGLFSSFTCMRSAI